MRVWVPGEHRAQAVTAVDASFPTRYDRAAPSHARVLNGTEGRTAPLRPRSLVYNPRTGPIWLYMPACALEAALLHTLSELSLCDEVSQSSEGSRFAK